MSIGDRLQHAWDAFLNKDPTNYYLGGTTYSYRPDKMRLSGRTERSFVNSIFNRIALDAASMEYRHCYVDENGRYKEDVDSGLNNCLTVEANLDQTSRAFIQDIVESMLDEGYVAIVPIHTSNNPLLTSAFDVGTMRTAKIIQWGPKHVKVSIYNENTGYHEDRIYPKSVVCIIENPLYSIINDSNSTMKRLARKLSLLDVTDEQTASGKLDLIVQLPYVVKSKLQKDSAKDRTKQIEEQLTGSKYGIAYIDGTEKITQLNRPIENNLMKQIEYWQALLFSQLGLTQSIMDGTADEATMINYYSRTIEPIVASIVDEMKRKFISKTARTRGQTILAIRNPFKLVPVNGIAEIADKFTRNEIMSSNEIRQVIGIKPSKDPKADMLLNSNLNHAGENQPESLEPPKVEQ